MTARSKERSIKQMHSPAAIKLALTLLITIIMIGLGGSAFAAAIQENSPVHSLDYLVKFDTSKAQSFKSYLSSVVPMGTKMTELGLSGWTRVQTPASKSGNFNSQASAQANSQLQSLVMQNIRSLPGVLYVQPNYKIKLLDQPGMDQINEQVSEYLSVAKKKKNPPSAGAADDCPIPGMCGGGARTDNPEIPAPTSPIAGGTDPLFNNQWGMIDIGVQQAWNKSHGDNKVIVAVIDSGVDYTHEDLAENLWRNPGEVGTDAQGKNKSTNGIDDDGNGYVDDSIGWDFFSKDNKPFDLSVEPIQLIFGGGNPGHGTHCAGNVAARGFNGKGVSGVAPNVAIMSLRFISDKGEGTTADAIGAINYAVANGAKVTSNSWGSEGEDPAEGKENQALRDAIQNAQDHGVLFIAAAGNGHNGVGYDNDSDAKPGYPATYTNENIISVAALDSSDQLGAFSNWGKTSVDIAAPGVKVYSTTVGSTYADTVIDLLGTKVTWDGTSMATPHVAGAAALYISAHPNANWREVKAAILNSAKRISSLNNKVVSGGKLNVEAMMNQ
ncbi:MAG: S8 family peptidase [Bdellovibrionales bacterium]